MSWTDRLIESRTVNAVELAARFAEARQHVLSENVANIDTPDYHNRVVDARAFQQALGEALAEARSRNSDALELRGNAQVRTRSDGSLAVTPEVEPAPNALFHDGTNGRLEDQLTAATENSLYYSVATNLLRGRYDTLLTAIRGRVS